MPDRDPGFYLLARHRQPMALNVARTYIEAFTRPGDLILDPFAGSPAVARAALDTGRRAICVDSNPLVAFATRLQLAPPSPHDFQAAVQDLAQVRREGEPLRSHILEQYQTTCAGCGESVSADYFTWTRDLNLPAEKAYQCPHCGPRRDPTSEADRARAAEYKPHSFQFHLLIERISSSSIPRSKLLRDRLSLYTPRNLYGLVMLTLKLDSEISEGPRRDALRGCLLHALDVGTSLYPAIDALPERKVPEAFVEMNVLRALEAAAEGLQHAGSAGPLKSNAEEVAVSDEPAAYVAHGSARGLSAGPSEIATLILSSPARLDPLFWELSYLWTRWLLGKEASRSLEPLLEEEKQRWSWYGQALAGALEDGAGLLAQGGHLVAAFPAGSHGMVEALAAAAAPHFAIEQFSFRPQRGARSSTEFGPLRGDYRLAWKKHTHQVTPVSANSLAPRIREGSLRGANAILQARAEPLAFTWVHHAALEGLAREGTLALALSAQLPARDNPLLFLRRELEAGLKEGYARNVDHWRGEGRVLWTSAEAERTVPLAEQVEAVVHGIFEREKRIAADDLEDRILERFIGLLTPDIELVEKCAVAYANLVDGEWVYRRPDDAERERTRKKIDALGNRLGLRVETDPDSGRAFWSEEKLIPGSSSGGMSEKRVFEREFALCLTPRFVPRALLASPASPLRGLIVLPESQVEWTRERVWRDPALPERLREAGWDFLRLPFVDHMLAEEELPRAELNLALGLDPALAAGREQLELF
ncbi:MAG: DNA methyltransferase [Rudaea sp.]